ncbi:MULTISPECIES: metal/formaldehyde-sensitive transcriptional repressor [unclassified Methylobacterium]|uniref:metal/formaldehyde-sensitive transcriptional repressor n=1 Tax=unclassified Methylobacterium TaxID=2615210 RepID=UPI0005BA8F44|nr:MULTISPECIES: metal/formaldehyde-sensitive transcriptional repressor [unclassified Methylobacterium]SFU97616.1 DNA-binding transcriptional regulator, FrmR family [Methylobacterium sp. UNCCL125]
MGNTDTGKAKLVARIRRLMGQAAAVERSVDADGDTLEILMLLSAMGGAIDGMTAEVLERHVRQKLADPDMEPDPGRADGAAVLIKAIRTYMK